MNLHDAYNNAPNVIEAQKIYAVMMRIWEYIQDHRFAHVEEIAHHCDVSTDTVRSYLADAEILECENCFCLFHDELEQTLGVTGCECCMS